MAKRGDDDARIFGKIALLVASLATGIMLAVYYSIVLGVVSLLLYPLVGFVAMLFSDSLIIWAGGEEANLVGRIWLTATWPISLPVLLIVCPTLGIIHKMFPAKAKLDHLPKSDKSN